MLIWDVTRLAKLYKTPFKKIAQKLIFLRGLELPVNVKIGNNVIFAHNAVGTVIHGKTTIEDDVIIFQGVTIGKADIFEDWKNSKVEGFLICKGAALCAGAKILCKEGCIIVGKSSIIAANAVLLQSTGDYEIWGGVPAKLIGYNIRAIEKDGLTLEEVLKRKEQ